MSTSIPLWHVFGVMLRARSTIPLPSSQCLNLPFVIDPAGPRLRLQRLGLLLVKEALEIAPVQNTFQATAGSTWKKL